MTLTERLNQMIDQAETRGVAIAGLEIWQPFGLLLAVGEKLGLSRTEILEPVDTLD